MTIKFINKGSDIFIDKEATFCPQIGWEVKMFGTSFKVIKIFVDYDAEREIIEVEVEELMEKMEFPKSLNDDNNKKVVKCIYVWEQNKKSLTLGKEYEIIYEKEDYFKIIDDKGIFKKYKNNNSQFLYT